MICEKTVFPEFIGSTSREIPADITGMKFQIDKKIKRHYGFVMIH
jgi:hypothetical protein